MPQNLQEYDQISILLKIAGVITQKRSDCLKSL